MLTGLVLLVLKKHAKALLSYLREPPYASTRFGESITPEHAAISIASGSSQEEGNGS